MNRQWSTSNPTERPNGDGAVTLERRDVQRLVRRDPLRISLRSISTSALGEDEITIPRRVDAGHHAVVVVALHRLRGFVCESAEVRHDHEGSRAECAPIGTTRASCRPSAQYIGPA